MTLFLLPALLMLAGALALLYFPWQGKAAADRDSLNRTLYQTRLDELAQEDNVADREAMVVELQRTLLADIPDVTPAKVRPLSRWVLLPGAAALVLLSSGIFLKTSDIGQVLLWQQAERQTLRCSGRCKTQRRRRCGWISWLSSGSGCAAGYRIGLTILLAGSCWDVLPCCSTMARRRSAPLPAPISWRRAIRWPHSITPAYWCGPAIAASCGWQNCCCANCISGSRTICRCWNCWR